MDYDVDKKETIKKKINMQVNMKTKSISVNSMINIIKIQMATWKNNFQQV